MGGCALRTKGQASIFELQASLNAYITADVVFLQDHTRTQSFAFT